MKITEDKLRNITTMFSGFAKEEVKIDFIGGALYVFGSELACLRIFYKYRYTKSAVAGYSKNRNTWYFSYETPFETYEMP